MALEFTKTPVAADLEFLTQKINAETPDFGQATPFAFFIRDEAGKIKAGCNGSVIFGGIYTDQLWVDPSYRKAGLGKQLMAAVEEYGHKCGCRLATVATMSFQRAQEFYEKIGYSVDFQRPGYTQNSDCLFMKKTL